MIKCGHCFEKHATVAEVRNCAGKGATVATLPPIPAQPAMFDIADPTPQVKMAHPKRIEFAKVLLQERDTDKLMFTKPIATKVQAGEPITALEIANLIDELLDAPKKVVATKDLLPEGRYAVEIDGKLRFFKITHTRRGSLWIKEQAGDAYHPTRAVTRMKVVEAIKKAGVQEAMQRYGRELGHCGRCGRTLTDEISRARGIGPVCWDLW